MFRRPVVLPCALAAIAAGLAAARVTGQRVTAQPAAGAARQVANLGQWTDAPPLGWYPCFEARQVFNAPGCVRTSLGCFGMQIEMRPVITFRLMDGGVYSDYDGRTGRYTYSAGVVTMLDGSRRGWRYKRTGPQKFQMLDAQGALTSSECGLGRSRAA